MTTIQNDKKKSVLTLAWVVTMGIKRPPLSLNAQPVTHFFNRIVFEYRLKPLAHWLSEG